MSDPEILVAKESFSTTINDTPRVVTKGETFRAGHPVTVGREEMFETFTVDNELEDATAPPGKKRAKSSARKAAKSNADGGKQTGSSAGSESEAPGVADYSKLKRPELTKLLEERGIEYPKGVGVKNAALAELLEEADKASTSESE
jgi:hypothetical protein